MVPAAAAEMRWSGLLAKRPESPHLAGISLLLVALLHFCALLVCVQTFLFVFVPSYLRLPCCLQLSARVSASTPTCR